MASLPIAFPLYLPEVWAHDAKRRKQAGIPDPIRFQTKPEIALEQISQAVRHEVTRRRCWPMPPMETMLDFVRD